MIKAIVRTIRANKGIRLLDYSSDKNHNRSVITFIGNPKAVKQAAFAACLKATELIDMTRHRGEHPRMGATDVIPFVPVKDITVDECIRLSQELGRKISKELSIPVFLYEDSATLPERKNLANIRRVSLRYGEKLKDPKWAPDFGKPVIHPTAGVVAIETRMPLIAYNINLDTSDINIANKIARLIAKGWGAQKC